MSAIAQQLSKLGITLSTPGTPAAAYVMAVTSGNQVFLSGHIAKQDGKPWV
ncbi:MAG: RidA family protein, partial [Burkholderiaceae bacterium]|nr:RidA family protein [Burkholderiaceae bacterium]